MLPVVFVFYFNLPSLLIYIVLLICSTLCMILATIFTIQAMTYLQEETPVHLIGKVIAVVIALCTSAQPVGQAVYGVLFEKFSGQPGIIILASIILSVIVSIGSKHIFYPISRRSDAKDLQTS